jgi:all-trans-retinol dehydrogenase (NAD+)
LGEPTILVNNAGVAFGGTILDQPEELLKLTFGVNVIGHFHTVREFLPYMVKRNHGHVISVASMASFVAIAQNVDYSCSKIAALAFHEGLTQEIKHRYKAPKIRTRSVSISPQSDLNIKLTHSLVSFIHGGLRHQ